MRRWLLAVVLGGAVAAAAYWRRALTLDGAAGAALVGCVVFARGGLPGAGALLTFFASSTALSRVGQRRKQASSLAQAKGAQRDAWQVFANGGFATLSLMLGGRRGSGAFLGALSAAGADTWATELGMLARSQPRMITTLRPVEPGTSGGVTPEGLAASLAGALVVGLTWCSLDRRWRAAPLAAVAGAGGSLIDSVLGATIQALYRCPGCDALTEQPRHRRCGQPADLVRGKAWVTNDTVNALSTLAGAAIGAAWWRGRPTREPGAPMCLVERGDRSARRRAGGRSARPDD